MNILFFLMLAIIAFLLIIITTFIYFGRKIVFIDAMELYKKGHEEEALDKLRSYVKTKKNDIKAKEFLAKIYLERGEVQNALKENVGITLSSASNNVEKSRAYGQMVKIYFDEKNYNKAIATAGKALKYNKQNVDVYFYLGKIYLVMDKERRANKMFNEVLKYDRNSVECRMELAELHIKEKNFTKARFHLKKILEIDDQNDQARFRLGEIFYAEDQLEDAAKEFEMIKNIEGKENVQQHRRQRQDHHPQNHDDEDRARQRGVVVTFQYQGEFIHPASFTISGLAKYLAGSCWPGQAQGGRAVCPDRPG
mgnify:FL=1